MSHEQPCAVVLHAAAQAEAARLAGIEHARQIAGVHEKVDSLLRSTKRFPVVVGAIVALGTAAIGAISQLQVAAIGARTVESSRTTGEQIGRIEASRERLESERQQWQRLLSDHRDCMRASR